MVLGDSSHDTQRYPGFRCSTYLAWQGLARLLMCGGTERKIVPGSLHTYNDSLHKLHSAHHQLPTLDRNLRKQKRCCACLELHIFARSVSIRESGGAEYGKTCWGSRSCPVTTSPPFCFYCGPRSACIQRRVDSRRNLFRQGVHPLIHYDDTYKQTIWHEGTTE